MRKILGVSLILVNETNEIFVIRELISKPQFGKTQGDLSIPMETKNRGEKDKDALQRTIREEIGDNVSIDGDLFHYIGDYDILGAASVSTYFAKFIKGTLSPKDPDVELVGWMEPHIFLTQKVRYGAECMIRDFIASSK